MLNFFGKKTEEISPTTPGFEESERKTPIVGKILLIIMFIAGLYFGWQAVNDLGELSKEPEPLSACSYRYAEENVNNLNSLIRKSSLEQYYYQDYYGNDSSECVFSKIEQEANAAYLFEPRIPVEKELTDIITKLNSTQTLLDSVNNQLQNLTQEYGVGLQEREVNVDQPVFSISSQQQTINSLKQEQNTLLVKKNELESERISKEAELTVIDQRIKEAYKSIFEKQNRLLRWYELKTFLWQFFFIGPFFLLVFLGYLRFHRKNSPYTIILTAMVAVAAVLLLRVILVWFWGLFLANVLKVLIEWFARYDILRSLLFYFGMILSFVIFGGAVYWLQKKIFDPRRVAIRRFRVNQCPHCQASLDLSVFFCPNCGVQLKEKCAKCEQARFIDLPSCPYCGNKK
ncbi:MAG: zinc ribbon domain-containing protein [Patescibacteria group bacterium]